MQVEGSQDEVKERLRSQDYQRRGIRPKPRLSCKGVFSACGLADDDSHIRIGTVGLERLWDKRFDMAHDMDVSPPASRMDLSCVLLAFEDDESLSRQI